MNDYFVLADTHFSHSNIIRYSKRPFSSADEMDEMLIQNWNGTVKPRDVVYFLGDFSYRSKDAAQAIRDRLNGSIYFVQGNHDKAARQIKDTFICYVESLTVNVRNKTYYCHHYAHRVWNKSHHGVIHLYGHSHNSLPDDPYALSMDVGVDATANRLAGFETGDCCVGTRQEDYRPISFDEVNDIMSKKKFKPIDHHGKDRNERTILA